MLKNVYGEYMGADEFAIQSSLKLPKTLKETFRKIWIERDHKCECCHIDLGEIPKAQFLFPYSLKGCIPIFFPN